MSTNTYIERDYGVTRGFTYRKGDIEFTIRQSFVWRNYIPICTIYYKCSRLHNIILLVRRGHRAHVRMLYNNNIMLYNATMEM